MARIFFILIAVVMLSLSSAAQTVDLEFSGDTVDEDVKSAVREALPEESKPKTALEARRQGRRATKAIKARLNSIGHYDPKIDLGITSEEPPRAIVRVDPGPLFTIGEVDVTFRGSSPSEGEKLTLRSDLPVRAGKTAIPSSVIDAERWIVNYLREEGYPYAKVLERRVFGDREGETISVTYDTQAGPKVVFGETIFPTEGVVTKASYLRKLIPYEEGDIYSPDKLSAFNSRLSETRMFKVARASLASSPTGLTDTGAEIRNIEVTLTERARNTIALGGSYSTSEGFGVNAEYTRRNLAGRGDTIVADLTVAELEQSLDVVWRRPNEFGYGRGLTISAGIGQETTDAYDRQSATIGVGIEVIKSPQFTYSYGVQGEVAHEKDEFGERDLQILSVYGDARIDKTDSLLDPRSGWRANLRVEPSYTFGDSTNPFVLTVGQVSAYIPFDKDRRYVLAGRLKAGATLGADIENLPVDTRFYSGGGGSVRGYAYQAIGPRADDGTPLGGTSVIEASIEGRYAWRPNIGFVAFVDAGNVSTNQFSDFGDARLGAGLGVRYSTPAGPIRFDIATPLNPTDFDDPIQIYISIGQAF
ncbi:autotransporter assembly complex protein TamA [Henriciella litoralis]|uniref:autotransporter assembly complex protein TamA n=1 Tax=Henriciella litoralis TaxID=568102 RepID=UPI0009FBCDF2|nr:autotransporter assembly complex family protein [Henriciella litoralis]